MKLVSILSASFILLVITTFALLGQVNGAPVSPGNHSSGLNGDTSTFSFASIGDSQAEADNFAVTVNQIASMHPDFVIFNGDLEDNGFLTSETDPMVADLKSAGLFDNTFMIRGNHDDKVPGSASLWESYFETAPNIKTIPAGVSNYFAINSSSTYLTYSYNFGNSIFIGLDVPGDVNLLTSEELNFLDARLTYAESIGLTHAFIYFHGPLYCIESTHCECSTKSDGSCTPAALVSVLNAHPIVSATFHGHEHILGWTHMDSSRVPSLTGSFEQFVTSPSGGWSYNAYIYPDRMDYYYPDMSNSQGFGYVTVNGSSYTFSLYKTGITTPVWTHTFTKGQSTDTLTPTPITNTVTVFDKNSAWKYYNQNFDLLGIPTPYYSTSYNDSGWVSGNGPLGYGESYLHTDFLSGNGGITYYFRKTFNITVDPATLTSLTLNATYDDGFVAYINGQEVTRGEMPAGTDTYTTAGVNHESNDSYETFDLTSQIGKLVQGINTIAVDVHNVSSGSSDIVWDASLAYQSGNITPTSTATPTPTHTTNPSGTNLLVYPYLGNMTTSSVNISWATDNSGSAEVHYSTNQSYSNVASATGSYIDGRYWYSANISGLAANTSYYYKIFNNGYDKTPWSSISFKTAPSSTTKNFDFVVVGDSQQESASATPFPTTLAIANQINDQAPNLVIHTGDMIYDGSICSGSTSAWSQYISNYFNVYQAMLGRIPFFTTIGNHEVQAGGCGYDAYKGIFTVPANAPSYDSEEYYSYDWGNAHFIILNTNQYIGVEGTEYPWLVSDLQATTKPWKFVFMHVPAYSSGNNGGDTLVDQYLVPLFETYGVNLVFSGHDHDYERSCPIKNGSCTTIQNGGVVYFVNGGGGAYTSMPSGDWFTLAKSDVNEFVDANMNDCQVQLRAIDSTGNIFDTYTLNRCGTPTPSTTPTLTTTNSPTFTNTFTQTATITNTPTFTATLTPSKTFTPTPSVTNTLTPSATNTATPTITNTPTFTITLTPTYTLTSTPTFTNTPSVTNTLTPSATNTATPTIANTPTFTITLTPTYTLTSTPTFTNTPSPTFTFTYTFTPTNSPSPTSTFTFTPSPTNTYTETLTPTFTLTNTRTFTFTPTFTYSPTQTSSPTTTDTPIATSTFTTTATKTDPTYTFTPTNTITYTPTNTNTLTSTFTHTYTPTVPTVTYTPTFTRTATPTSTFTFTATNTFTPIPTNTATFTFTQTPTFTNTQTFTASASATNTSTATITATPAYQYKAMLPLILNNYDGFPSRNQLKEITKNTK